MADVVSTPETDVDKQPRGLTLSETIDKVIADVTAEAMEPLKQLNTNTESGDFNASPDALLLSPAHSHSTNADVTMDLGEEITVATAISSDKARSRQLNVMLDKYLAKTGNNLYPHRDEKERLAKEMNVTFQQVNRWFANRRRKQTKRSKMAVNSPVMMMATSAAVSKEVTSRVNSPLQSNENAPPTLNGQQLTNAVLDAINALSVQQGHASKPEAVNLLEEEEKMEQSNLNVNINTPEPLANDAAAENPMAGLINVNTTAGEVAAKLLALQQSQPAMQQLVMALLTQQLQPFNNPQLQALALQQQIFSHQLAQIALAQQAAPANQWGGSSISASPVVNSDSEVSDLAELSPRSPLHGIQQTGLHQYYGGPSLQPTPSDSGLVYAQHAPQRPNSPPFKDPHNIADPEILRLLDGETSEPIRRPQYPYLFEPEFMASSTCEKINVLTDREMLAVDVLYRFPNNDKRVTTFE
ncbi:unnamed protein product [Caenorhabditis auriculariae]|uniref:Homeobox domain-containing protein n=1 Tax=Caenorhabditis auriculariae TaxID=2777116 RepID=A0A8S1HNL7_9PELO|nr:unnamed protein product [Caenorhabditis auriculariae]